MKLFLLKNLRRPYPPKNLVSLADEAGYIVERDYIDGTTKILDKAGLEIEFLIGKKGSGEEETMKTNLGVTAQALRHLDILSSNVIDVDFIGFEITVPSPEAYAVHKMVINDERKDKREKDRLAIINIYPFLDKAKISEVLDKLNKKERSKAEAFIDLHFR